MWGLDFDGLKWLLGTLGIAAGWVYDRLDKRAQRKAEQSEAVRTVKAQAETITAKNAELAQLRDENERLLGALLACVTHSEAHG